MSASSPFRRCATRLLEFISVRVSEVPLRTYPLTAKAGVEKGVSWKKVRI
jgi:hypothetical protein